MNKADRLMIIAGGIGAVVLLTLDPLTDANTENAERRMFYPKDTLSVKECAYRSLVPAAEYIRIVSSYKENSHLDLTKPLVPGDSVMLPIYYGNVCGEQQK